MLHQRENRPFRCRSHAVIFLMVMGLAWAGCQNEVVCEDVTAVNLRAGFYRVSDAGQESAVAADSITIYGMGKPEARIYNNQKNVARIELPLNPAYDTTAFVMIFPGGVTDTLTTSYDRQVILMSVECGFTMFYDIQQITSSVLFIDSCVVVNSLVSNTRDEHIKIYVSAPAAP